MDTCEHGMNVGQCGFCYGNLQQERDRLREVLARFQHRYCYGVVGELITHSDGCKEVGAALKGGVDGNRISGP